MQLVTDWSVNLSFQRSVNYRVPITGFIDHCSWSWGIYCFLAYCFYSFISLAYRDHASLVDLLIDPLVNRFSLVIPLAERHGKRHLSLLAQSLCENQQTNTLRYASFGGSIPAVTRM
jgi:hypothetical protein